MDVDPSQIVFETDIYVLPVTVAGFSRWLDYSIKRLQSGAGVLMMYWEVEPEKWENEPEPASYKPALIIVTRIVSEDGDNESNLDLLLELRMMPIEEKLTLIELTAVPEKRNDIAYQGLIHWIEESWPQARKDRAGETVPTIKRPIAHWTPPAGRPIKPPDYDETHKEYLQVQESLKLVREVKRNARNVGGHPPLASNEWAFEELSKRPGARHEIREQWRPMYLDEVGEEVAELRDLTQAFNAAMRYRSKKKNRPQASEDQEQDDRSA